LKTQQKTHQNQQLGKEKACGKFENLIILSRHYSVSTYLRLEEVLVQRLLTNFVCLQGTRGVTDFVQSDNGLQQNNFF